MTSWQLGPYRALDHRFVVRGAAAPAVRARLEHALAPLLDEAPEVVTASGTPRLAYRVDDRGEGHLERYVVSAGGRTLVRSQSSATAAGFVMWHVNQGAVKADAGRHLLLHAAGVQRDGVTVALPAPMESGKSTTTAALLRAGYGYLTDETLAIEPGTGVVAPYPKPLSLSRRSVDVVGGITRPTYPHAEQDSEWLVPWWDLGCPGVPDRAVVDLVVLPRYVARGATGLLPVSPGEATLSLAASTFEFARRPRRNLEVLAAVCESVPVFSLTVADLPTAVRLVDGLVAQQRGAGGRRSA